MKICENITFSKYAFYFINNSLYFITLYIINECYYVFVEGPMIAMRYLPWEKQNGTENDG